MSDCCDLFFGLMACCCACSFCINDPRVCSCFCKKQQDEDIIFPEVIQNNQPRKKDPMTVNNGSPEVVAARVQQQQNDQNHTG
ncbi:hypothetical protein M405DRAFT_806088 [Rhizopogon salebrosus TDB-379]|nr:hypothetical protein M405DRAFT_806088 [Rhizopogon salebrosus TDB-379]